MLETTPVLVTNLVDKTQFDVSFIREMDFIFIKNKKERLTITNTAYNKIHSPQSPQANNPVVLHMNPPVVFSLVFEKKSDKITRKL